MGALMQAVRRWSRRREHRRPGREGRPRLL